MHLLLWHLCSCRQSPAFGHWGVMHGVALHVLQYCMLLSTLVTAIRTAILNLDVAVVKFDPLDAEVQCSSLDLTAACLQLCRPCAATSLLYSRAPSLCWRPALHWWLAGASPLSASSSITHHLSWLTDSQQLQVCAKSRGMVDPTLW
jgi:hypothetical protein